MSDLRDALDRESERFPLAPGALDRMLERRHRMSRRRRIGAAIVALAVTSAVIWAAVSLGGLGGQPSIPANPVPLLTGTWRSGHLSEADVVGRFVAAGGTTREGRAFFAQLGRGATRYAVVTLRFRDGSFLEFESGDGGPPIVGYEASYAISRTGVLTISAPGCAGTYGFRVAKQRLRLIAIGQCAGHDGPYNTTLFASFPLTKQG